MLKENQWANRLTDFVHLFFLPFKVSINFYCATLCVPQFDTTVPSNSAIFYDLE